MKKFIVELIIRLKHGPSIGGALLRKNNKSDESTFLLDESITLFLAASWSFCLQKTILISLFLFITKSYSLDTSHKTTS